MAQLPFKPHTQTEYLVEWSVQRKKWPNGMITRRIMATSPTRSWVIGWDGLDIAECNQLENHYNSVAGTGYEWLYVDIHTNLSYAVIYASEFKRRLVRPNIKIYRIEHKLEQII